jgi:hypothetical protein
MGFLSGFFGNGRVHQETIPVDVLRRLAGLTGLSLEDDILGPAAISLETEAGRAEQAHSRGHLLMGEAVSYANGRVDAIAFWFETQLRELLRELRRRDDDLRLVLEARASDIDAERLKVKSALDRGDGIATLLGGLPASLAGSVGESVKRYRSVKEEIKDCGTGKKKPKEKKKAAEKSTTEPVVETTPPAS